MYRLKPVQQRVQIDSSDPARKPPARADWAHLWLHEAVPMEAIALASGTRFSDVQRTVRRQLSAGPMPTMPRMRRAA